MFSRLSHLLQRRLAENVPKTQDNMRDPFQPHQEPELSGLPEASTSKLPHGADEDEDDEDEQPRTPSCKVLVTTSPKVTRATYDFCEELVAVFPDSEFVRRLRKNRDFSIGNIAVWAARRGYTALMVVNEDRKVPSPSRSRLWRRLACSF